MDFGNSTKLRFFTNCILFLVLKRLEEKKEEEEERGGGGSVVVTDFVTNGDEAKSTFFKNMLISFK